MRAAQRHAGVGLLTWLWRIRNRPLGEGLAAWNPEAPDGRQGTDDRTGELSPIPAAVTSIIAHAGAAVAPLTSPPVQDDPNPAHCLEGSFDLSDEEGAIARHHRIANPGGEEAPRTLRAYAVGYLRIPRSPLCHRGATPGTNGPHRPECYPRSPRFSKHFRVGMRSLGFTRRALGTARRTHPNETGLRGDLIAMSAGRDIQTFRRCLVLRSLLCYPERDGGL